MGNEYDNKIRLCGAKFAVYNQCGEKVCEGVTDKHGELCFDNLPLGEYYVKELCPPEGFCPCRDEICVKLRCDDRDKVVTVVNKRIKGCIKIIKYGEC